ncbi:MAG: hypothetical protein NDJ24_04860 [Alphaproteobacteria bacterium]|nr:hypothetical protein [Alphaproteobacteria bacterium]
MSVSFMSPNRTVLLIGDESLFVYSVTGRSVRLVDTVPWATEDFVSVVTGLLAKACGGKPVLILNDMTDQYFKGGQRLPNVGMMDKQGVLRRKLQVAFPNYPIRGALPVKQKKVRSGGKPADKTANIRTSGDLYLFAGVPMAEPLAKVFEAIRLSMVAVAGFALLPVEASDMVHALSEKLAGKGRAVNEWAVFIGQHQSGALRQIITRNGQLAMTRITTVSSAEGEYQSWANDVYQEFKATLSYLSRYGFSNDDGADLMLVASPEAGAEFEKMLDIPCNFTSFTANEAARILGMAIGVQEESRFADPLHVAWCGRKVNFILKMDAPELTRIHQPRQTATAVAALLVLGGCFVGWQAASQSQVMMSYKSDIAEQKRALGQAQAEYDQEVARLESLGFDVKLIQASLKTFAQLEENRMDVLPVLRKISDGLGDELRVDRLTIKDLAYNTEAASSLNAGRMADSITDGDAKPKRIEAIIHMSFPQTISTDEGRKQIDDLERRLKSLFPEHVVWVEKNVGSKDYKEVTSGEVRRGQGLTVEKLDMQAEIRITGPLI